MAYHNLLSKSDRALMAYLVAQGAGSFESVFPAKRSLDRSLPCTVCYSESAMESAPYSGTYLVKSSIMIRTCGAVELGAEDGEARASSDERVAAAFDAFHMDLDSSGDKLADAITAAARALAEEDPDHHADLAEFTVQNVAIKGINAGFEEGSVTWVDTLDLELVCSPSALTEEQEQ